MSKQRKTNNYFTASHGQEVFSHPQKSLAPSHITVTWESKHHHSEYPLFLILPTAFIADYDAIGYWDMPLVSCSPSCAPPNFLCTPSVLSGEDTPSVRHKRPWLCASTAQQKLKCPCVINTVFSTSPKHNPMLSTVNKINFTSHKTHRRDHNQPGILNEEK